MLALTEHRTVYQRREGLNGPSSVVHAIQKLTAKLVTFLLLALCGCV